jgi:pimeloyl-ACP methyl ester carboxylesterase
MQTKNIIFNGAGIFYRVTGNGKPVVLLHGFGEDGEVWNRQWAFLQDHFTLIIPDLPGSGQSAMIADMSIEGIAEVIKHVVNTELLSLTTEKTENICIIGHSMGGYITLALVQKYPQLVNAFGLFHSSAFADNEEKKVTRLKAINFIHGNGSYEFLKTSTPGLFLSGQDTSQPLTTEIQSLIEKGRHFTPEALIAYYQAMINRPDRTAVLKNFPRPVLFIIGEHDKAIPFDQSMQQVYFPAQSHIHILRNSAHMGMWEETDKANTALLDFLLAVSK